MEEDGVYCSTAGTFFQEREQLQEHYQSEFHRYVDRCHVCICMRSSEYAIRLNAFYWIL